MSQLRGNVWAGRRTDRRKDRQTDGQTLFSKTLPTDARGVRGLIWVLKLSMSPLL